MIEYQCCSTDSFLLYYLKYESRRASLACSSVSINGMKPVEKYGYTGYRSRSIENSQTAVIFLDSEVIPCSWL
ncbi:hypothetical protein V6Z12_A13G044900 [Gossypium hirsutum]